jgi:hypothetical protein
MLEANSEKRAAAEAAAAAYLDARAAATRAIIDGDKPTVDPEKVKRHTDAKTHEIEARISTLEESVDVAGNELAAAVGVHAEAWAAALDASEDGLAARRTGVAGRWPCSASEGGLRWDSGSACRRGRGVPLPDGRQDDHVPGHRQRAHPGRAGSVR